MRLSCCGVGDGEKIFRLQAGTTDKGAVNIFKRQNFLGISGLHRTAIEKAHPARSAKHICRHPPHMGMHGGDVINGRRPACADSQTVGNNNRIVAGTFGNRSAY